MGEITGDYLIWWSSSNIGEGCLISVPNVLQIYLVMDKM